MDTEATFLDLKTCLEDYQSQGCRLTKKTIREYVFGFHSASMFLPRDQQNALVARLIGVFL
jgi:hypothetical protein